MAVATVRSKAKVGARNKVHVRANFILLSDYGQGLGFELGLRVDLGLE